MCVVFHPVALFLRYLDLHDEDTEGTTRGTTEPSVVDPHGPNGGPRLRSPSTRSWPAGPKPRILDETGDGVCVCVCFLF